MLLLKPSLPPLPPSLLPLPLSYMSSVFFASLPPSSSSLSPSSYMPSVFSASHSLPPLPALCSQYFFLSPSLSFSYLLPVHFILETSFPPAKMTNRTKKRLLSLFFFFLFPFKWTWYSKPYPCIVLCVMAVFEGTTVQIRLELNGNYRLRLFKSLPLVFCSRVFQEKC